MKPIVLDASALLTLLFNAPGALDVKSLLSDADKKGLRPALSTVQLSEVCHIVKHRPNHAEVLSVVLRLEAAVDFVPLDAERAVKVAEIRREMGLSFADAVAVALALERNAVLVTADRDFKRAERRVKIHWIGKDN